MDQIIDLLDAASKQYPIKALAPEVGKAESTLRNELTQQEGYKLGLITTLLIMQKTGDLAALDRIEALFNRVAFVLPRSEPGNLAPLVKQVAGLSKEFGEHMVDGIAGENIIIESSEEISLADLGGRIGIENQGTGELAILETVEFATPCGEFAQFCLQRLAQSRCLTGVVTAQGGVAAAHHDRLHSVLPGHLRQVASNLSIHRCGFLQRVAAGVGQHVEGRVCLVPDRSQGLRGPLGQHKHPVDGLSARGVIVQHDDLAA